MRICYIDDNEEYINQFRDEYGDVLAEYTCSFMRYPDEYIASDEVSDIVLLDIEFGKDSNGLDYLNDIVEKSEYTQIIIVTAYTEKYIEDIFMKKDNVAGFLKKPIDRDNMLRVLARAGELIKSKRAEITVKTGKYEYVTLKADDVLYIESTGHNITYVTATDRYTTQGKLDNLSGKLPSTFVRCHKSFFVNLSKVKGFTGEHIIMEDQPEISVSRSKKAEFIEAYRNHIQK